MWARVPIHTRSWCFCWVSSLFSIRKCFLTTNERRTCSKICVFCWPFVWLRNFRASCYNDLWETGQESHAIQIRYYSFSIRHSWNYIGKGASYCAECWRRGERIVLVVWKKNNAKTTQLTSWHLTKLNARQRIFSLDRQHHAIYFKERSGILNFAGLHVTFTVHHIVYARHHTTRQCLGSLLFFRRFLNKSFFEKNNQIYWEWVELSHLFCVIFLHVCDGSWDCTAYMVSRLQWSFHAGKDRPAIIA